MKLISFAVPCYNSEAYMRNCIDSLLKAGEDAEILIVNDGSTKDNTAAIADEYAAKYPTICRAIHQQNKGHGGACNAGMQNATGEYFKVVDSDDWLDEQALLEYMKLLRGLRGQVDLFISNYVYEKQGRKNKMVMRFHDICPAGRLFAWKDVRTFRVGEVLTMHTMTYRTQILRDCGLVLPEHTFYVDNIFAFQPYPYVTRIYYMDINFYHYFIGREDQSVNEQVMIGRIDQQIKVNKIMVETVDLWKIPNKKLRKYMLNYLEIITVISTIMCIRSGTEENLEKKRELWKYIKEYDIRLFHRLRNGIMGQTMNLPGKGGRKISIVAYKISQKVVGFN